MASDRNRSLPDFLGINEEEFEELARRHVVAPNQWKNERPKRGKETWDFDIWSDLELNYHQMTIALVNYGAGNLFSVKVLWKN